MLNNLGLLSTIAKSFIRHHQCIIIYEIYALLLQEAHTRNKKMTYLNIFLIVFEQERTRRKKERITPPPSTSGVIGCHGAIFLIISEP